MSLYSLKKQFLYFFTLLLFINCSKEESAIPENAVFEPQTELISLTRNSNELKLTWKPVVIKNFISYKVYRFDSNTDEYFSPSLITNFGELIYQSTDNVTDFYVDTKIPFNSFIGYAVVTDYIDEYNNKMSVTSINFLSYENEDLSFSITSLEKLADGSLKLIWDKDANTGFENYSISVHDGYAINSSEDVVRNGKILKVHTNQENHTIIDASQYNNKVVSFAVSKVINGKTILSKNSLSIENPRNLNFQPGQTLKNPYRQNELVIINPKGEIIFYDVNSLTSNKLKIDKRIFFCSIGELNGVTDLYVPSENGRVFVIDLISHEIKKVIHLFTDFDITSAITIDDHLLFIEKHPYADIGGMFVYDFASNKVLNRNGTYTSNPQSKLVYAKDNYFFFLAVDGLEYGSSCTINKLNIHGNTVSTEMNFGDSRSDSRLFTLSDDKSFFISSNLGYQSTIDYQNVSDVTTGSYSKNPVFGDAKISENNLIYFAYLNNPLIEVFEKNNFTSTVNQYSTTGNPMFIELFGNQIISLNQLENSYFVETISK
jgi:hypothetical protein